MYALKIGLFQGTFSPYFPLLKNDDNGRNILPPTPQIVRVYLKQDIPSSKTLQVPLIHLSGFFHEILPRFEHSWISTSICFYHGGKTVAISMFLIFEELLSLY